jgi:hypothetical protein
MTLKHLGETAYHKLVLTSFMEGFRARTSALQAMEKAWQDSEANYFGRSIAWPKKSSPSSYSLKTSQLSLPGVEPQSLGQLPKWGMIVDGVLYPLQALVRYIVGKGGSFLPTPTTMDNLPPRSIEAQQKVFQTHRKGRTQSCNLREWIHPQMWPTPDAANRGARKNQNGHHFTLQDATGSGKLNPTWVEWLMGYPKEHTVLEHWAMQWFQNKRKKRSKS